MKLLGEIYLKKEFAQKLVISWEEFGELLAERKLFSPLLFQSKKSDVRSFLEFLEKEGILLPVAKVRIRLPPDESNRRKTSGVSCPNQKEVKICLENKKRNKRNHLSCSDLVKALRKTIKPLSQPQSNFWDSLESVPCRTYEND